MSAAINKHGLNRNIPDLIARDIRKRSGFGCVICGLFLYIYEHIDPEFSDSQSHDPERICLLCPNHHARVTKGLLSKDEVSKAYLHPYALQRGYAHDSEFSHLRRPISVELGAIIFQNSPRTMLQVEEEILLALEDEPNGLLSLSGKFYDRKGQLILEIVHNEWRGSTANWDIEQVGKRLTIRQKLAGIVLSVTVESEHRLIFDHVEMNFGGARIVSIRGQTPMIVSPSGASINVSTMKFGGSVTLTRKGGIVAKGGCYFD